MAKKLRPLNGHGTVLPGSFEQGRAPWLKSSLATLSEKVYAEFKRDIIHGVFQPGEALSEKDLARRYRASRTPVREAAVRLQKDRLLRIVPNRGYFVSQITLQILNDIYEFRSAVECAAVELAAIKGASAEAFKRLDDLAQVGCTRDDRRSCLRFIEADTAFHLGIAQLTRNQMLFEAVHEARSQMERIMLAAIDINYFGEVPNREHMEILKAIRNQDAERARRRMHDHIMQSKDKVLGIASVLPARLSL
ncbi:MAG: GntR family transcriptional regulator [Acidobacteriaceae bacterium]|nr:GntR family transcriptional regulator [Acidobacteriaceae bacterium]